MIANPKTSMLHRSLVSGLAFACLASSFSATALAQQTRRNDIFGQRDLTATDYYNTNPDRTADDEQAPDQDDPARNDRDDDDPQPPLEDLQLGADGPYTDGPYANGPYSPTPPAEEPQRLPREMADPYAPLGIRAGGLLIFPEISLRGGYTDNVARTPGTGESGTFTEVEGAVTARSNWNRHAFESSIRGSYTSFHKAIGDDEAFLDASALATIDILRSTQATVGTSVNIDQEQGNRDAGYGADIALSHRFNRLTGTISGAADWYEYSTRSVATGSAALDDVADYRAYELGLRLGYELSPTLTVFTRGSVNRRVFNDRVDTNGFLRGSDGYAVTAGADVNFNTLLRGTVEVGYQVQNPDETAFDDVAGLLLNADMTWAVTPLTNITARLGTEFNETTTAGSPGSIRRSAGVGISHALRRNVTLTADFGYADNRYQGAGPEETETTGAFGIEYLLGRNLAVTADYTYYAFDSTTSGAGYTVNSFLVGVKLRK